MISTGHSLRLGIPFCILPILLALSWKNGIFTQTLHSPLNLYILLNFNKKNWWKVSQLSIKIITDNQQYKYI